jgi:hypothetical protein
MNKNSRYFAEAAEEIQQNYLNAEGWENVDDDEFAEDASNASGDALEAEGTKPMTSGKSQPYTIVLANTTTTDVSSVVILNAGAAVYDGYATAGITYSYEPSTVTYQQFLASILAGKVFSCNQLRLIASNTTESIATQQVLTSMVIETKDPNGNLIQMPFVPDLDNYQFLKTQSDISYVFNVDAMTKITIATLYASTTLKIRIFPGTKINQFAQLRGTQGVSKYTNPKTNRALSSGKKV